jgi:HSP20 family protein
MTMRSLIPSAWSGRSAYKDSGLTPFCNLHREIDRLFDNMFGSLDMASTAAGRWPAIDMSETEDAIRVRAELPGMSDKDVEVSLNEGILVIRGKHAEEKSEGSLYTERMVGEFERRIALPVAVQDDGIEASFDKGLLTVTLPKSPSAQVKRIEINKSTAKQIEH